MAQVTIKKEVAIANLKQQAEQLVKQAESMLASINGKIEMLTALKQDEITVDEPNHETPPVEEVAKQVAPEEKKPKLRAVK